MPLDDAAEDLGPNAPPAFLVPPTVRTASAVEAHTKTFDAAFAPSFGTRPRRALIGAIVGIVAAILLPIVRSATGL